MPVKQERKIKIIDSNNNEIEISNHHWPLAESLFLKWNAAPSQDNVIKVKSVSDISPELSAWGIPWKRTKWN